MRIFIRGIDGYIGYALAMHLVQRGNSVGGCDTFEREQLATRLESPSVLPHELANLSRNILFFENLDFALTDFEPNVIIDVARTFTLNGETSDPGLLPIAVKLRSHPTSWLVLSDIHTYVPANLPIPENELEIFYEACSSFLLHPIRAYSIHSTYECLVQTQVNFFRNIWKLPVVDLRIGLVYGVTEEPWHRLHVDEIQGNLINYFCAKGVKQGIVNIPFNPVVAIISIKQLCLFIESLLVTGSIDQSPIHVFDQLVSLKGLGYKLKHVFAEDFDLRLRLGFSRKGNAPLGWATKINIERHPLNTAFKSLTIEGEFKNLIRTCFGFRKKINKVVR